ncbi:MAG: thiamine phosphate synthase [Lachnospiraceae bacterium]|nr:thiamine phosphate synthase [Lachnospiraceae bacterium]
MTMSTCKVLCVTNRRLVRGDFLTQIERIAAGVTAILLREKDLPPEEYVQLAKQAAGACAPYGAPLIPHTYTKAALRLGSRRIHLPGPVFFALTEAERSRFETIGVSVHSAEEARAAASSGASYLTAGHVFATDCKRGLPPRGLPSLEEVCAAVDIPVYAIGGITPENAGACLAAGAEGVCLMSSLMEAVEPEELLRKFYSGK